MSPDRVDVAVIGGGPAGSSAAIALARSGLQVTLFEAKQFPRHKLCGEFLSPECMGLLERLGVDPVRLAPDAVAIHTVCFTGPGGARWEARLPSAALGLSREKLDAGLIQQARSLGVEVCEDNRVIEASGSLDKGFSLAVQSEDGLRVVRAGAVIGAQGKRSALDARLNRRFFRQPQPFVALKAHFRGPPVADRIEMHTFPGGYCGISEIEGGRRNVCLLVRQAVFQQASRGEADPVEAFIGWMAGQNELLGAWLRQAEPLLERWISIAQVPFSPKPAVEQDILMAGDAAGLIAPLAGDGIAIALETGQLAGRYLARYLADELSAEDLRRDYPAAWNRCYARRFRIGRVLQPLLLRPATARLGLRALAALPPLGQLLIRSTRGQTPPAATSLGAIQE